MKSLEFVLLGLCLCLLSGCINLKPKPDMVRKYTLGKIGELVEGAAEIPGEQAAIFLMRPHLPGYLDSMELRYRSANGEVLAVDRARWAEPLHESLARALAQALSKYQPVVGYYPFPQISEDSARLTVTFERFDALNDGSIQVVAHWTYRGLDGRTKQGRYADSATGWASGDPDSLVAGYHAALAALAESLTGSLP